MRELTVSIDGKHYRGTWQTWADQAWGQMVEVTYRDSWLVRAPVGDGDPEHAARRCLEWCVREAVINDRHR